MTTITLERKNLEKEIGLLDSRMQEKMVLAGVEIDSVSDNEITLDITPNRPDLLSMQGFIRFMSSYLGKSKPKVYTANKPEKNYKVTVDKSVKDVRPFTACAIVKGIKLTPGRIKEIVDIQEKLHLTLGRKRKKLAIGIYPLEKISLPIKFEARKPSEIKFKPLDMPEELTGLQILQRHPTGREYANLLEGKESYPVFVDANGKILSMPPIINSHETGKITEETKEIFVECSGFNQAYLEKTLNILTAAFADMGGKIYQMNIEGAEKRITPNLNPEKMAFSAEDINRTLGLGLTEKEIRDFLERMGVECEKNTALIPAYRTDMLHWVDLAEEVAIAYGYDKLVPKMPEVATIAEESAESKIESNIAEALTGLGMLEISSLHLIKEEESAKYRLSGEQKMEVADSKTDYKLLRPNLTIPALRVLAENKDNEYPQKLFEIGTVFRRDPKTETGISECKKLLITLSPANFTELKQTVDYLFRMLALKYQISEGTEEGLIEGRTGKITINGKIAGHLGEMHPETLRKWNVKMPVALAEISLDAVFKEIQS